MAKNIVICCDGTGNEYGRNNTNVVGLYEALIQDPETRARRGYARIQNTYLAPVATSYARNPQRSLDPQKRGRPDG